MKMELPVPVLHSLFALNQAGYEAYVVGGCVRDAMMGKKPMDWDITTSALPEETLAVFQSYRTIETGIRHGTVTVVIEDMPLEITTYRVDGDYSDGRHPDEVSFTRSLKEDLRRRDFTVNAMAYHPHCGLVDPFHGQRDLKRKVIRCVGNPKKRFHEDALRILRGLRFSSTLGFSIHPATASVIHRLSDTLSRVSIERVSAEFLKLLCGQNNQVVLTHYPDVLSTVLSDMNLTKNVEWLVFKDPLKNMTVLLFDTTPETAKEVCKRLRLSNRMTEDVVALVRHRNLPLEPTRSCVLRGLHVLGPRLMREFIAIKTVTDSIESDTFCAVWERLIADNDCCYQLKDLAVNGEDLLSIGISDGPELGAVLNGLINAVMDGVCPNQKEELLKLATKKPVQ